MIRGHKKRNGLTESMQFTVRSENAMGTSVVYAPWRVVWSVCGLYG